MSILSERISANRALREHKSTTVEEWGDGNSPLQIFFSGVTGQDIDRVTRKHKDFLTNPSIASMVELIIIKAEDSQGEKLFTIEDKKVLLNEPLGLIADLFGEMFSPVSVEEQEKN